MKAPKDIVDKVKAYEELKDQMETLRDLICEWICDNGGDGVCIEAIYTTCKPTGDAQHAEGEYCEQQSVGYEGDSFNGTYYHQSESDPSVFLAYDYWC